MNAASLVSSSACAYSCQPVSGSRGASAPAPRPPPRRPWPRAPWGASGGAPRLPRPAAAGAGGSGLTLKLRDERPAGPHLFLVRRTLEEQLVQEHDARLVGRGVLKRLAIDDGADLLDDERTVHQEQRLLRHRRLIALAHRHRRRRDVEGVQHLVGIGAIDEPVHRATRIGRQLVGRIAASATAAPRAACRRPDRRDARRASDRARRRWPGSNRAAARTRVAGCWRARADR